MTVRLYTVPASHPSAAAERALQLKGADYERIDLITTLHRPVQRVRFGGWSVPSAILDDGTKVLGSRRIMRALDERYPEPSLFPAHDVARAHVERAEQWGEEVLQPLARRVTWAALRRAPQACGARRRAAQDTRRASGWSTSSPHCSARSTCARATSWAGKSEGSG